MREKIIFTLFLLSTLIISCNSRNINYIHVDYFWGLHENNYNEILDDSTSNILNDLIISKKVTLIQLYKQGKMLSLKLRKKDTTEIDYFYNSINYKNALKYQSIIDTISKDDKINCYVCPTDYYYWYSDYIKKISLKFEIIRDINHVTSFYLYLDKYNQQYYLSYVSDQPLNE